MSVKLLTEHHLEFLSLKGGCTGSSESTMFKMPHCWKSHVTAQLINHVNHKKIKLSSSFTWVFQSLGHVLLLFAVRLSNLGAT